VLGPPRGGTGGKRRTGVWFAFGKGSDPSLPAFALRPKAGTPPWIDIAFAGHPEERAPCP